MNNFTSTIRYGELGETLVDCLITNEQGKAVKKTLTLDKYINMLSSHTIIKQTEQPIVRIGKTPQALYDGGLSSDGRLAACMIYPANKWYFSTQDNSGAMKNYYLNFPALVFFFKTAMNKRVTTAQCFAIKDEPEKINGSSKLYLYPYGNVSHTGGICYGSGSSLIGEINDFSDFEKCVEIFFSATTHAHYYQAGVNTKLAKTHFELVEYINELDSFPNDILQPADLSLSAILDNIK